MKYCNGNLYYYNKKENEEEVVICLTAKNPQAPQNKIRYSHMRKDFVSIKLIERMIDHLEIESSCLHKDSDEARKQLQLNKGTINGEH